MQRKSIWVLSILVLVVSFLSVLVINHQALAAWYYPDTNPPGTTLNNRFVFNPAFEDFNLNGKDLLNVGQLCFGATDCKNSWSGLAGSSGGESLWSTSTININNIYYRTGFVGIGTSTPNYVLEVVGDNGRGDVVKIKGTGYSSDLAFYNDSNIWAGAIGYENYKDINTRVDLFSIASGLKDMRFLTGSDEYGWGTERMRIQASTGNVGIGTTNPTAHLQIVDGADNLQLNGTGLYSTNLAGLNIGALSKVTIIPAGNTLATFEGSTKRVGIGTETPITKLSIYDASSGPIVTLSGLNTNYRGIKITNEANAEKWFYGSNDINNFVIRRNGIANGNELTVSTSNGNVAIGANIVPTGNKLYIEDNSSILTNPVLLVENKYGIAANPGGGTAIKGVAYGYSGGTYSHGVEGAGKYAIYGRTNNDEGAGIWGEDFPGVGGNNSRAAYFKGDVTVTAGNKGLGFLQIESFDAVPSTSSYCNGSPHYGRMFYQETTDILYICGSTGWRKVSTTPNL